MNDKSINNLIFDGEFPKLYSVIPDIHDLKISDYEIFKSLLPRITISTDNVAKIQRDFIKDKKTYMSIKPNGVFFGCTNKYGLNTSYKAIPLIEDVKVINERVVIVTFSDKTIEKAVLCKGDVFSLEQGISICITKKLLSSIANGKGSYAYNKLVDYGLKVYETKLKNEEEQKKIEAAKERQLNKRKEKERRRKEKLKTKEREEKIEIQAEAIRRAMKANGNTSETAE